MARSKIDTNRADEVVRAELQGLLSRLSPSDAPYLDMHMDGVAQNGVQEEMFNAPAGGTEFIAAQWFLQIAIGIAIQFLVSVKEEAIKAAATAAVDWIKKKFGMKNTPEAAGKTETIEKIKVALTAAGWAARDATLAAEEVWMRGETIGERLIVIART